MKATLNPITLAADIAANMARELEELDRRITDANLHICDEQHADSVRRQYCHMDSLMQGLWFVLDSIEEDDIADDLIDIITRTQAEQERRYADCLRIVWSYRLQEVVLIKKTGEKRYEATFGNNVVTVDDLHELPSRLRIIKDLTEEATA